MNQPVLRVSDLNKSFTMHLQSGKEISVLNGLEFEVHGGECVVLDGSSGAGKSTILKMVFGNYLATSGHIELHARGFNIDIANADPRTILAARRNVMGYVSQFLRCVPRVSALDVVAEPLIERGTEYVEATSRAAELLSRLGIPERLWSLPPATFSGGEQQRVNIARGFIVGLPLLLLDEPTASLDSKNSRVVIDLIAEKIERGTAILGIFHDPEVREIVADRLIPVEDYVALERVQ